MSRVVYLLGLDFIGKYVACRGVVDCSEKNILVYDKNAVLARKYYKSGTNKSYQEWLLEFSHSELLSMLVKELVLRLSYKEEYDYIFISGEYSLQDIKTFKSILNINDNEIIYIKASYEMMYRNFTLRGNLNVSYEKFVEYMKEREQQLFVGNLEQSLHNYHYVKLESAKDLFFYLDNYINDGKIITVFPRTIYQWPIEPKYKFADHDFYGERPHHMITKGLKFHSGLDITAETTTPIKPAIDGIVVYSGLDERILSGQVPWNHRYGNMIEIVDEYGRKQVYAHLRERLVQEGEMVTKDDVIGLVGCSGGARVPHLHFEVRKTNSDHSGKENTINPLLLLPERRLELFTEEFAEEPYIFVRKEMVEGNLIDDGSIPYAKSKKYIR